MRKVIESSDGRTEMTVDTVNSEEKVKKSINLWENFGFFGTESCDFSIEKANLLSFISIKPINLLKMVKKFIITMFL